MSSFGTLVVQSTPSIPAITSSDGTIASGSSATIPLASMDGAITLVSQGIDAKVVVSWAIAPAGNTAAVDAQPNPVFANIVADWFGAAVSEDDPRGDQWFPFGVPQFGSPIHLFVGIRLLTDPPFPPPGPLI